MIQKAVWETVQPRRFHPAFLKVHLHQRNRLYQLPRYIFRQHSPRFRRILPDHKPHFRRCSPAPGSSHPLQKRGYGKRGINLKRPFQAADIDPQLQCRCGYSRQILIFILHGFLCGQTIRSGKISMVNQKTIRFPPGFTVLAKRRCNGLRLLSRIAEDQAFHAAGMFKDIPDSRIRRKRSLIGCRRKKRQRLV